MERKGRFVVYTTGPGHELRPQKIEYGRPEIKESPETSPILTPSPTTASPSSTALIPSPSALESRARSSASASPEIKPDPDYTIFRQLSQRLEDLAIVREYGTCQRALSADISESALLARFYINSDISSPVRHAIEAHALTKFSESNPSSLVLTSGRHHYAKALKMVQARLNDPRHTKSNELAVTVWVFAKYENITSDGGLDKWESHIGGLLTLLSLRDSSELGHDFDFYQLLYAVTSQILPNYIRRSKPLPRFSNGDLWLNPRVSPRGNDDPSDVFIRVGAGIAETRAKLESLLQQEPTRLPSAEDCLYIMDEAVALDNWLDEWYHSLPAEWRHFERKPRHDKWSASIPRSDDRKSWPHYRHVYPSKTVSDHLSHYFFFRIHAVVIICKCSNVAVPSVRLAEHNAKAQLRLRDWADDYCAWISTIFEEPGHHLEDALITLAHVKMLEVTPPHQRRWIDECCDTAVVEFGKVQALRLKAFRPCLITGRSAYGPERYNT